MILGAILILSGILIAVYPPLLSLIVAILLIFVGSIIISLSYRYKQSRKRFDDPFIDFFMRV